ncbi:MAG: glycosyltransferase [Candidatus Omnitrophica bacterium]|nr:glycosyltransferase [Candidatus Omnitrophota bacterium]MBU1869756.1 glycosyltransferase [Candidatus Omnitrophota bacterium]
MNKTVSIVIPSLNSRELLKDNLPVLIRNTKKLAPQVEIIVVDDGSTDGTSDFLRSAFSEAKVITLEKNMGFAFACNAGVKESKGELVYLLNSDIKVSENFLEPLVEHFQDPGCFAVSSVESEGQSGISLAKFKMGIFWYWYEDIENPDREAMEVFCVSGGHSLYDKKKFLELRGFDTLFSPIYAEDGDICWRAWKTGWKSLIEPRSVVAHECQATLKKLYSPKEILNIHWKNRLLMTWKNISPKWMIAKACLLAVPGALGSILIGKSEFAVGFLRAVSKLPELMTSRKRDFIRTPKFSDYELFRRFSHPPKFKPYKILYLHETAEISGAENSLLNLVKNLNKDLFKPVFVLPGHGALSEELRKLGIEVLFMDFPRVRCLRGVSKAIGMLKKIIKEKNASLIHSNSIRTHIYGAIAAKKSRVPCVWHQRNLITSELIDPDMEISFLADKIICNSQAIARRFQDKSGNLPEKVAVVYNGVDLSRFNPCLSAKTLRQEFNISDSDIVIGIASRFGKDKGHEVFLRAARLLGNYKFLIVGDAVFKQDKWREAHLRKMAQYLGMSDKIIFSGPRKDMPEVYAAMDIFVLASEAEPCGRVLIEAMSCAKPVVATNSGGTPEIVQDGKSGILFKPKDARSLANAIEKLAANESLRRQMGEQGRKIAEENFSIALNVLKIEEIYKCLIR